MWAHRWAPPTKATPGGRVGLRLPLRQCFTQLAASLYTHTATSSSPTMLSLCLPPWVTRAQCSVSQERNTDRANLPPQVRLRSMTWKRIGGVSPRCPAFATITYVCAYGHPPVAPGHPRAHHVPHPPAPRHSRGSDAHRVCVRHSRDARTSPWLLPDAPAPPPAGTMHALWISWACGYGYGVAVVLWCGGWGAGGHGRARGRWGWCPGAVAGWLFMVGESWVVYYVRSATIDSRSASASGASPLHHSLEEPM